MDTHLWPTDSGILPLVRTREREPRVSASIHCKLLMTGEQTSCGRGWKALIQTEMLYKTGLYIIYPLKSRSLLALGTPEWGGHSLCSEGSEPRREMLGASVVFFSFLIRGKIQDFSGNPVVKTSPSKVGGMGSIPGWGAKIPHGLWLKIPKNIKQKPYCNKINRLKKWSTSK